MLKESRAVLNVLMHLTQVPEASSLYQPTVIGAQEYPKPSGKHMDKLESNIHEDPCTFEIRHS
jgi:hypothetical protein